MKKAIKICIIYLGSLCLLSFTVIKPNKIHHPIIGKWLNLNNAGEFKTFEKNKTFYNSIEKDGVEKKILEGTFKVTNNRMYSESVKKTNVQYKKTEVTISNIYRFSKNADTLIINQKEYFKRVN